MSGELLRKTAHNALAVTFAVLGGLVSKDVVLVSALVLFVVFLVVRLLRLARAFHGVPRVSYGELFFAGGIVLSTILFLPDSVHAWYAAMLVLGIADTLAALVGQRYPYGAYTVLGERRTIVGSGACFLVSALLLNMFGASLVVALLGGVLLAAVEAAAPRGSDNLLLPVMAGSFIVFL